MKISNPYLYRLALDKSESLAPPDQVIVFRT